MKTNNELKENVKEVYSSIVESTTASCCGGGGSSCGGSKVEFTMIYDDYKSVYGYTPEADLGLGCGIPTMFLDIKEGDTVVDLGSGAGNDAFIVSSLVGNTGKVIGIDMTEAMISKANSTRDKLGKQNVEFVLGDIENMPIENESADIVISNCVLNLVPDKAKAFSEIHRVLKNHGRFSFSDIVIQGKIEGKLKDLASLYAGCITGAIGEHEYLDLLKSAGFDDVEVKKRNRIDIPKEILLSHITEAEYKEFEQSSKGVFSITVTGNKSQL